MISSLLSKAVRAFAPLLFAGLFLTPALAASTNAPGEAPFERPTIVPVPHVVGDSTSPVISLSGDWQRHLTPQGEFWRTNAGSEGWETVQVPGGRGGARASGVYAYRKSVPIPANFAGQRAILRFDGVSNAARLWVNGALVREHWGSFMAWTADITPHVTPGQDALVVLEVDDRPIGLAKFVRGGGIQKDVKLYALPKNYIARFGVETDLDAAYRDASLRVRLKVAFNGGDKARVRLTLRDAEGKVVALRSDTVTLTRRAGEQVVVFPVTNPKKWDAEHPNLYSLEATVLDDKGAAAETVRRSIGFREVEVRGNRFFVNGAEVKLRGVWGGSVPYVKSANANHTRQLWATDALLDEADRAGLYVLDEIPVDFAKYGVESDPQFKHQWMSLISDLMERDYSHPSIIMWGLVNESFNGASTLAMHKYVKAEDPQRPTMHSWANRVPTDEELPYDIYSSHYPDLIDPNLDLGGYTVAKWHSTSLPEQRQPRPSMPVLHDEYAHSVLNRAVLDRDPNVRNFWGESIYRYWAKMVATPGALGGDIFGLDWGGAGSPEHLLAAKAYSPLRIDNKPLALPGPGEALTIPVENWYNHTNLNELKIEWSIGGARGVETGPDVAPGGKGVLRIPPRAWRSGDQVLLSARDASGFELDQWRLAIDPPARTLPVASGPAPVLQQTDREITVTGRDFRVVFNRGKGLISEGSYKGKTVIIDGPFIELLGSGLAVSEWWCDSIAATTEGNEVVVRIRGNYAVIRGAFEVRIDGAGLITTKYVIDYIPGAPPPATFSPWDATSIGGYSEVGVSYVLPKEAAALTWERQGLWSIYPEDHLGRTTGKGLKGSTDFRATKENIFSATAEVVGAGLTALSDGKAAVRLSDYAGTAVLPAGTRMAVLNEWNYPDIGLGNYAKPPLLIRNGYSNTAYVRLGDLAAAAP